MRANAALARLAHVSMSATAAETESCLRVIRMLAIFKLEHGMTAWENARSDAEWIIAHSTRDEHRQLAKGMLHADEVREQITRNLEEVDKADEDADE